MTAKRLIVAFAGVVSVGLIALADVNAESVSFNRDIRPLLSSRCFACHGPDEGSREAGLRLDQADGDEGAIGYAIEPGSFEDSELWNRIISDDESVVMPPPESHLKPFNERERQLIRQWIDSGADYEDFWAFTPPTRPTTVSLQNDQWSGQPIDQYVLEKLESLDRSPSQEANPRTLIRRATLDLTGLPPTLNEIEAFVSDYRKSPEVAWTDLIDELLSRPAFGEHFARYWLDLVRFADTNGMHKDYFRNHVAYRDWIIRAFNENLPYDDFVRYQLAGDLFDSPSEDQLVASGFNRLHLIIDRGTALPEESFTKNVIDRVTAVGTAFMGLTVQCAQCHDHKFDPITQKDFFSLYAFFNNIDAAPETAGRPEDGFQPPFVRFGTEEQHRELDELNAEIDRTRNLSKQATEVEKENEDDKEKLEDEKEKLEEQLKVLNDRRKTLDASIPKAMVMKEREEVRETFVLERGQYDAFGERVERGTPSFLPPLKKSGDVASRMDLAEWLVDPANPLTARVAVNRFWQVFFGVGITKTSEDFGNQGEVPSHPRLLDALAYSFVDSGWNVKSLVRSIALSKTYRQASSATPDQFKQDPENRLLARGPRFRLDAEMIRDQILATSGLLSPQMYGPSVKPPQPPGLWKAVSMIGETFSPDEGDAIYRRSVYTFWKRAMPPPQMTILNAPIRDACIARRERTNTPTQALLLLNESEYLRAARALARSVLQEPQEKRIDFVWETITARLPDSTESRESIVLIDDLIGHYTENPKLTEQLCDGLQLNADETPSELAAWTLLTSMIYNLDLTKTKE